MFDWLSRYFDTDEHPGVVSIVRFLGAFLVGGIILAALMGYGWPWAPSADSNPEFWAGWRIAFAVWILVEVVYALVRFNRSD